VKADVAARLRPRRIAEIGVRAGCSAFAFLSAVPGASYLGVDADVAAHGGIPGFLRHARAVLDGLDATLLRADTRRLEALPGRFDSVHVDGDHSYAGCLHDLGLAARAAPHILVDDYDSHPEVRQACHTFLAAHPAARAEYLDDGLRGNLLLTLPG
jgi:predicted O-methyltransferase YrrM